MESRYMREIAAFTRIYCTDKEIKVLGQVQAAALAANRDAQAAEALRLDCEG
jgi:hypothetical protein